MLAAPIKSSNKALDWEGPLKVYIGEHFGGTTAANAFVQDFQILTNSRQRATQVIVGDKSGLEAVQKYLGLVDQVQQKFPLLKQQQHQQLQFTWTDSFRPKQKPMSLADLEFERCNVLYNLAALEGLAGINQDLKSLDSIKLASGHFARAAGIFALLEQNQDLRAMTVPCDLSPESLHMLKWLMLAQTQVCFLERALLEDMRVSILSKIAYQCVKFYEKAIENAKSPVLSKSLDGAWLVHLEFHKRKQEAFANFYFAQSIKSQAEATGNGYGELVAWLRQTELMTKNAIKWGTDNKMLAGLLLPLTTLLSKVTAELSQATKDNETIYFASVPTTLPALQAHVLAKEIEFQLPSQPQQVFKNLYPSWMGALEREFQHSLGQRVNELGNKVEYKINEVRQGLQDANLPASVEVSQSNGIPQSTMNRIGHGTGQLELDVAANVQSREFLQAQLVKLQHELELEAQCVTVGAPSQQLNQNMHHDLTNFSKLLAQAKQSDESLLRRITTEFTLLNKTKPELDLLLPPSSSPANTPKVEEKRTQLSLVLIKLGQKIVELEQAQIALTEECTTATLLKKLTTIESKDRVKSEVLEELNALFSQVESKLGTVQAMFSDVLEHNFEFQSMQTEDESRQNQVKFLNSLDSQIGKHRECVNTCREGAKFYAELATQIQQLGEVVEDFCFVRNLEREEAPTLRSVPPPPAAVTLSAPPSAPTSIHIDVTRRPSTAMAPNPVVAALRNALGVDHSVSDSVLQGYITKANGDVNEAAMAYFENPPQSGADSVRNNNNSGGGGGGGWFQ
ncbi:hypothetical protein BASA81_008865 [Batrachochytrium salamandrivorans]|nr:hypothetical protein BASA81_008865 [Batrachochytrium salamandrivorans]